MRLLRHRVRCKSWGGGISLSPVVEGLKRVEKGVDRTASELAIARLNKEILELRSKRVGSRKLREQERSLSLAVGIFASVLGISIIAMFQLHWLSWLFGLMIIVGGIYSLHNGSRLFSESDEEKQVIQQISDKKAELTRHQQIVES